MTRNFKRQHLLVVLSAVLVATAGMTGGAGAAAPSIDATTHAGSGVSTTSEITADDTLGSGGTFDANASNSSLVQYQADSNNSSVEWSVNDSDRLFDSNSSADSIHWNTSDDHGHFNITANHGDWADMEHGIDENVSVDLTVINDTDADSPDSTTEQINVHWNNDTTVEVVSDSEVDDDSDFEVVDHDEKWFGFVDAKTTSDAEVDERDVDGDKTDVVVVLDNGSMADTWDDGVDSRSSEDKISATAGLFSGSKNVVLLTVDGTEYYVPVFYKSAPEEFEEDHTYAVYEQDYGGEDAVVLNLGESFDDADEVEVELHGNAGNGDFTSLWGGPIEPSDLPDTDGGLLNFLTIATLPLIAIRREDTQTAITTGDATALEADA